MKKLARSIYIINRLLQILHGHVLYMNSEGSGVGVYIEITGGTRLVWLGIICLFCRAAVGQKLGQFCCNRYSWPLNMNKNVGPR